MSAFTWILKSLLGPTAPKQSGAVAQRAVHHFASASTFALMIRKYSNWHRIRLQYVGCTVGPNNLKPKMNTFSLPPHSSFYLLP